MRSADAWAEMYSKHVASNSPEELAAFAAAIQMDAIATSGDEMDRVVSAGIDLLEAQAGKYSEELFQG